jgi:CDP-diacylglycerol---glycerol-3-phosphate 3-phosphatidyltransferase
MHRNLPNALTILRLVLATIFFIVLNQYRYEPAASPHTGILWASIILFSLAAITDMLDGYLARRWHVESRFGRIMDPFCDKVLIIGAFIFLAGPRFIIPDKPPNPLLSLNMVTGIYPWMVVVILARELLVTGIRDEMEGSGVRFGANLWGKLKMILQSTAIPLVLLLVWLDPVEHRPAAVTRDVLVYATVIVTALSGWPYVVAARRAVAAGKTQEP